MVQFHSQRRRYKKDQTKHSQLSKRKNTLSLQYEALYVVVSA